MFWSTAVLPKFIELLKYVKALVYQDNIGSIKALKKNGFSIDGKFINKIVYKNKRRNELSLSKSIWKNALAAYYLKLMKQ